MTDLAELEVQQAGQPARRTGPLGAEIIGPPACPILHRWTLLEFGRRVQEGSGSSRSWKLLLHHFLPNADDRAEHDHPRPFWTLVLWGGYNDRVPCPFDCESELDGGMGSLAEAYRQRGVTCPRCHGAGEVAGDRMRPGMLRYRPATYRHRTRVLPSGCWTLVLMGPKVREWGFWREGRWWPWREHEKTFGFGMRCPTDGSDG